jgi:hypothetical protein
LPSAILVWRVFCFWIKVLCRPPTKSQIVDLVNAVNAGKNPARQCAGVVQSGGYGDRTAFDRAAGEILRQLMMPFACLGCNGAMGGGSLFGCPAHVETLV